MGPESQAFEYVVKFIAEIDIIDGSGECQVTGTSLRYIYSICSTKTSVTEKTLPPAQFLALTKRRNYNWAINGERGKKSVKSLQDLRHRKAPQGCVYIDFRWRRE